ncbi:hypothetical protein [Sinomonas atrocyanea]
MSTKIGNGYRLKPGIEPFDFIARLREAMDPARDLADAKLLASLYTEAVDRPWFRGEPIAPGAGWAAWRQWRLDQSKLSPMDREHDPNEFGVQIGKDPVTGRYCLLRIAYNEDLRDVFGAMDEVEEYGSWNSTDELPDGVTAEEWAERRDVWDRLIPRTGRSDLLTFSLRHPSDDGLGRFLGQIGEGTEPVFAAVPSDRERAATVGPDAYCNYLVREKGIDPMTAGTFVVFRRGADQSPVIDVAAAHLLPIIPELMADGTDGAVIDPWYRRKMADACAALYELDRDALEARR